MRASLKRYVDEVVLCFDSDDAGQNAAVRSLDSLLASGVAIRVAVVPAPHDPDSFIKEKGGAAFRELIDRAEGFFDFFLGRLCRQNEVNTDKGRLTILEEMAAAVHKTGNGVLVDTYAQKAALRLGVSPESVRAEFRKSARRKVPDEPSEPGPDSESAPESPRPATTEFWLLKLLLIHDDTLPWVQAHLDPDWIPHAVVRQVISQRLAAHASGNWESVAAFLTQCETSEARTLITEATTEDKAINSPLQQVQDIVLRLRNQFIDRQMAALTQRSSQPELGEAGHLQLLKDQQALRAAKRQPLTALGGGAEEEPF